jgi:hypothetical protein
MVKLDSTSRLRVERLIKALPAFEKGLHKALLRIGSEDQRQLRSLIKNPPASGRFYGRHQASAPGEAPASRSGKLARSAGYRAGSNDWLEVGVGDRTDAMEYARYLEEGTKPMEARPYVLRAHLDRQIDNLKTLTSVVRDMRK